VSRFDDREVRVSPRTSTAAWSLLVAAMGTVATTVAPLAALESAGATSNSGAVGAPEVDTVTARGTDRSPSPFFLEASVPGAVPDSVSAVQALRVAPLFTVPRAVAPIPAAGPTGEGGPVQEEEVWTDAWGQERNFGLATLGTLAANIIPWAFNELVPFRQELKISQISPRSWGRNVRRGWQWDDNAFQVNFFAHPFQGNMYYNAARSNGYNYWTGLAFATAGSFMWECCGETHLMSLNDWATTSLGGAALGEALYRTTSMILDNQATGGNRIFREIAAGLLNPERGFARLVTGNTMRVYDNPEDRADRDPEDLELLVSSGVRWGESARSSDYGQIDDDLPLHGFVDVDLFYGTIRGLHRQKPFDFFRMGAQINFIKGRSMGEIRIRGNLWHTDIWRPESGVRKLLIMQDFGYINNPIYERGGVGASLVYHREYEAGERNRLSWNLSGSWTILGGVNSLPAKILAEIEGARERYREYDFGIGPGAAAGFFWSRNGRQLLNLTYDLRYWRTVNGSNGYGFDSDHTTQALRLRGFIPLPFQNLSVGVDYELFIRDSYYEFAEIGDVHQRAPILKIFASWNPSRGDWVE
jgi:hypothetical protein